MASDLRLVKVGFPTHPSACILFHKVEDGPIYGMALMGTIESVERSGRRPRTLVIHTGGLGDFLLFCPSLLSLREDGPVVLAGETSRLNLAIVAGIVENVYGLDDVEFHTVFSNPNPTLQAFLKGFDRAIVWMKDEGTIRQAFESCGVCDVHAFSGLPPENWSRHASEYYGECLGLQDLPPLRLPIVPSETAHDILIHPGSGGTKKNWPLERFVETAERLIASGRTVEWCLGPAEENWRLPATARLLESPSVVSLARQLAATHTYLGNDSGVTHLAAACGCRTVAVFGPTDPAVWAPRGEWVTVVRSSPWPAADAVLEAVKMEGK